jgi:hypothetical protein
LFRVWPVFVKALIALSGLAACGSSGGSSTPIPLDDLPSQVVSVDCKLLVRCSLASDETICHDWLSASLSAGYSRGLGANVKAVEAGRTRYDPNAAGRCLDGMATLPCGVALLGGEGSAEGFGDSCANVFTGTEPDGSSCVVDAECLPGSYCAIPSSATTMVCMGTCTRGGTSCNEDSQCATGRVCDFAAGTQSSRGSCVVPVQGATDHPCGTNFACPRGFFCAWENNSPICRTLAKSGEPCFQQGCVDGLVCAGIPGTTSGTCVKPAKKGEACVSHSQCGGYFLSALACDPGLHVCVDAPSSGPCVDDRCDPLDSYCDLSGAPPTCKPYLSLGAPCDASRQGCGIAGAVCEPTDPSSPAGTCTLQQSACE